MTETRALISRSPATVDDFVFHLIEHAAINGQRCPQNDEIWCALENAGLPHSRPPSRVLSDLAKQGRLTGGIYAHNWRRLWLRSGPHAGRSTQKPPFESRAYVVYDRFGASRVSRRWSAA